MKMELFLKDIQVLVYTLKWIQTEMVFSMMRIYAQSTSTNIIMIWMEIVLETNAIIAQLFQTVIKLTRMRMELVTRAMQTHRI